MAEQIIIEFIGDTSKLTPAIDVLQHLGQIDAKAAEAFKKGNAELSKRTDTLKKVNAEEQKQVKTLNDVEKAVKNLADTFITEFQKGAADALDEAGVSVEDFEKTLNGLGNATENAAGAQETLKKQLKDLTNELSLLESQGKRNSKEYNELINKAGDLKDAISDTNDAIKNAGSDTSGIDNLISLAGGVAGGFAIAQGAAALFGSENEEVQKTLVKVNAAMAILQGWQQISDLLSKRQFQSTAAFIGIQRVQAIQTTLQSAAESQYTIVRYGAIAAQRLLNAVIAASPLGIAVVLIGAVAAAWAFFADSTDNAKDAQKELNGVLDYTTKTLDAQINATNQRAKISLAAANSELATNAKIYDIQKKATEQNIKDLVYAKGLQYDAIADKVKFNKLDEEEQKKHNENYSKLSRQLNEEQINLQVQEYENKKYLYEQDVKSYAAFQDAKVFQARKGSIAEIEAQINATRAKADAELKLNPNTTPGERAKIFAETNRQVLELENQITIKRLENQKYLMEAKLATIKEGTIAELKERKLISEKTFDIEIATIGKSDEKLKALRKQKAQEQKEFDRQISERRLQFELTDIQTSLAKSKEGSVEQFNFTLNQLQKQYQIDIIGKGVTDKKKLQLEAEYLKQVENITKQYNRRIQEEAIQVKQSDVNTKLAELQKASLSTNNAELLKLKQEAIDEQAQLEIVAANFSINNEELKQAKIKEIIAKANAEKRALLESNALYEINYDTEITNIKLENEKKAAKLILAGDKANLKERIAARKRLKEIPKDEIDEELRVTTEKHIKRLISEEDYQKKLLEIKGKYIDLEIQQAQEKENRKKELVAAGFSVLQQLSDAYFEADNANRQTIFDNAIKVLEDSKAKELDNKNLTEQQKADINAKYQEKERQLKRKNAEDEKKAKIAQAAINGALAITNILATMPKFDFGVATAIAIAASIASTAIAIGKIKSTQIPQFKTGTRNAPAGYALVGEEGPEVVKLAGGEKIYKYSESMKIAEAWRGGSVASADDILTMGGRLPSVGSEFISNSYVNNAGSMHLDYDKLGAAVADKMPKPMVNNIIMDENGFSKYITSNGNKTTILNKKFKF